MPAHSRLRSLGILLNREKDTPLDGLERKGS
jgi:hypothetical protein